MEHQGAVQGVALAPEGPVGHHRGQQQEQAEAQQGTVLVLRGEVPHQPEAAPGQNPVKEDGEQLDQIQIRDGQVGDGGQEIEVGGVVVADGQLHGGKAAAVPERGCPLGQEHLVIGGLVVQQQGPQENRQPDGQQGGQHLLPAQAQAAQQPEGQPGQGQQEEIYGGVGGRPAQGERPGGQQAQPQQKQPGPRPGERGGSVHRQNTSQQ